MHHLKLEIQNTFNTIRKQDLSIGATISHMQRELPDFDFYTGKLPSVTARQYIQPFMESIINYQQEVRTILVQCEDMVLKAKEAAWHGNIECAIFIYQALIQEEFPSSRPYDQLIHLFHKRKDTESEHWELKRATEYFSRLQQQQTDQVMLLADRYHVTSKVQDMISARKRILYYADAYILYKPLPILREWQQRLMLIENRP
jgi:hypothetical protein